MDGCEAWVRFLIAGGRSHGFSFLLSNSQSKRKGNSIPVIGLNGAFVLPQSFAA
jgi:hypothetical protein